ncbi:hypothetical protein RRG08_032908 [Elysia crispata]|uniref:Uncharacterized protein n=1 Tax=Elysia crispata TaxID=231223 RepID=A0AAE1A822_9GAST|nr:hypothetical protein RRG08_032908 [Elysia crispata]
MRCWICLAFIISLCQGKADLILYIVSLEWLSGPESLTLTRIGVNVQQTMPYLYLKNNRQGNCDWPLATIALNLPQLLLSQPQRDTVTQGKPVKMRRLTHVSNDYYLKTQSNDFLRRLRSTLDLPASAPLSLEEGQQ